MFLNELPEQNAALSYKDIAENYEKLFFYRDIVLKALEEARGAKVIGKSLDANVTIRGKKENDAMGVFAKHEKELAEIFIVSGVEIAYLDAHETPEKDAFFDEASGLGITVTPAGGTKCARCWKSGHDREHDGEGAALCPRCRDAVC